MVKRSRSHKGFRIDGRRGDSRRNPYRQHHSLLGAIGERPHESHLSQLGNVYSHCFGVALALPHRKVVALDSDGNLILNLCSLGTLSSQKPRNLLIVVFDNGNYLSGGPGGGQPGNAHSNRWPP